MLPATPGLATKASELLELALALARIQMNTNLDAIASYDWQK